MAYAFLEPWHLYLPRGGGYVVAFFGGGGKTSLMRAMAEALVADGAKVIVTTTTETEPLRWPDLALAAWDDLVADPRPERPPLLFVGRDPAPATADAELKWSGLAPEQVDRLAELCPDRVVLVEADGSAGLPLKLHRDDEPVWPGRTSLAVAVVGLAGFEERLDAAVHRWGRLPAGPLSGLADDTRVGWPELERLVFGPGGYLDRVPADVPTVVALLQMEQCVDSVGLFGFLARLMGPLGVPIVTMGDLGGGSGLRTAYREDEEDDEDDGDDPGREAP